MSFVPLRVAKNTPAEFMDLIDKHIGRQFKAAHTILRLPVRTEGLFSGCHFVAGNCLLTLISGLSALRAKDFDTGGRSRRMFKEALEDLLSVP